MIRMKKAKESVVTLEIATVEELSEIKADMQAAFAAGAAACLGDASPEKIPSDQDMEESFHAPHTVVWRILSDGQPAGGAVLLIDEHTQQNALEFFYVNAGTHNNGIGLKAWQAIEKKYPKTKRWETFTPCFEKRNINFYVNKCGFQIVEYFNPYHMDAEQSMQERPEEEFFRFEKIMPGQ